MASPSSRRKSGSSVKREFTEQLLRDGFAFQEPSPELLETATYLETTGLLETRIREYVLCADPQDRDFPPENRHCQGRTYVGDDLDETGHDFRCPECERPVFPFRYGKRRRKELQVKVDQEGVLAFVRGRLAELKSNVKDVSEGVFRSDIGDLGVILCIADYCTDRQFLTLDWARTQVTCYLVVNPTDIDERFLDEDWIHRATLADTLCGEIDFKAWIQGAAASARPESVRQVSIPVYTKGALPILVEPVALHKADRLFVVECGPNTVFIDKAQVVAPQAGIRFQIFRILWDRFLDDLRSDTPAEKHSPVNVKDLMAELRRRTGEYIDDETRVRRALNYLQFDIETAVKKKLGLPIDRQDIVQTCRWKGHGEGDHGYRINPFTVAVRPFLPERS